MRDVLKKSPGNPVAMNEGGRRSLPLICLCRRLVFTPVPLPAQTRETTAPVTPLFPLTAEQNTAMQDLTLLLTARTPQQGVHCDDYLCLWHK